MSGLGMGLAALNIGAKVKGIGKAVFGPTGLKVILVLVLAVGGYFLFTQGKKAYQEYSRSQVAEITLTKENARVKQAQQEQAVQYQQDLQQQRVVFERVLTNVRTQVQTMASTVNRQARLNRDFTKPRQEIANARPDEDAPAAPVLDRALDWLRDYEAQADARSSGGGDANADGAGGAEVRPGAVRVPADDADRPATSQR